MSRTDKTNPAWLACEWEPVHGRGCSHYSPVANSTKKINASLECDLPDEPSKRWSWDFFRSTTRQCDWQPDWPSYYRRWTNRFYGRERYVKSAANRFERGVRAAWRDYRQKALSSRDFADDVTPPDARHRHFALWDRW